MYLRKNKIIYIYLMMFALFFAEFNTQSIQAVTNDESYAGNQLQQLGVLNGYSDGSLGLDRNITRAEVATMMVRIRGYGNRMASGETKTFVDITNDHWAYNHVQNAYRLTMIQGYPDHSFQPEANIKYQEVVAIMVNTLGYKDQLVGEWPMNYITKAKEIGVIPLNSQVDPSHIVTRGEMALIVWDTLLVKSSN